MGDLIQGSRRQAWEERRAQLSAAAVPDALAQFVASADSLFASLGIIEIGEQTAQPVDQVARVYFALGDQLDLHWFGQQIRGFEAHSHWQALACDGYLDGTALGHESPEGRAVERVADWLARQPQSVRRWQQMLSELRSAQVRDCSIFSVALRELQELSQA